MANTKSAAKRARVEERRREHNREVKSSFRTVEKKIRKLVAANNNTEASDMLPKLYSAVDKAVKKGVITRNKASRSKARITRALASAAKA